MRNNKQRNSNQFDITKVLISWLVNMLVIFAFTVTALCAVESEETVDRQLGILFHPWKIILPESKTLHYLRSQATSLTGLPHFAQQPQYSDSLFYNSAPGSSSSGWRPSSTNPDNNPGPDSTSDSSWGWSYSGIEFQSPIYELNPVGGDRDNGDTPRLLE